jgi:hypothetical protein
MKGPFVQFDEVDQPTRNIKSEWELIDEIGTRITSMLVQVSAPYLVNELTSLKQSINHLKSLLVQRSRKVE